MRATHAAAAGGERIIVSSGAFHYQELRKFSIPSSCFERKPDDYDAQNKVDLAAELGIPNVPRGEPGSTKGIKFILNLESKKSEELLGLNPTTPLKDVVAESAADFKARGYPGFTA